MVVADGEGVMCTASAANWPRRFVVKVARSRLEGVTLEQIAADIAIHPMTLSKWLRTAAVEDGDRPGVTKTESVENRELKRRVTKRV